MIFLRKYGMKRVETSILTLIYSSNHTAQKTASASTVFCSMHPLCLGVQATLFSNQSLNLQTNLPTLKNSFKSYILDILIIQFLTQAFIPFFVITFYTFIPFPNYVLNSYSFSFYYGCYKYC
jgi:hypothetical protein